MESRSCNAICLDASALAKVFCQEPYSEKVRTYFNQSPTKYTTPFCFYETLNVLKGKWKYKKMLQLDEYLDACLKLTAWFGASSRDITDLDFTNPNTFFKAKELAERFKLDLSDAFQILSVRSGFFSPLVNDSSTVLVTADEGLAKAARTEGLRVWNVTEGGNGP